jgi:hypothetical protein
MQTAVTPTRRRAGNGEGTNPKTYGWNAEPVWDMGQDVDGDWYLNYVDNCPTVADSDVDADTVIHYQRDTDGDGVGDVCDAAPTIPGDGEGYPAPGMFDDYDNLCSDPWTVGAPEGSGDPQRQCLKDDAGRPPGMIPTTTTCPTIST